MRNASRPVPQPRVPSIAAKSEPEMAPLSRAQEQYPSEQPAFPTEQPANQPTYYSRQPPQQYTDRTANHVQYYSQPPAQRHPPPQHPQYSDRYGPARQNYTPTAQVRPAYSNSRYSQSQVN